MESHNYDMLVIGGGPGGMAAAELAAVNRLRVCVINDGPILGDGIEGAFKSKSLFEIARHHAYFALRPEVFGPAPNLNFGAIAGSIQSGAVGLRLLREKRDGVLGIDVIEGRGQFVDAHIVMVGEVRYSASHIIVATGTRPRVFSGIEVDGKHILTSDHIGNLEELPESMLVLGAGVIGCEYASMFGELGCHVTLIDTQPQIMPQEDEDLSRFLTKAYRYFGITVLDSCRSKEMVVKDGRVHTLLSNGQTVVSDVAVLAVGRIPNSEGLDLAAAGVDIDKYGYIAVDEVMRTNISHIYAVGDIGYRNVPIDMSLVHVAEAEGRCAALSILGRNPTLSMQHVPFIIFTLPMIAGAGMNERMARDEYGDSIRIGKYPYGRNHRAHAMHTPIGFVKLIVAPEGDDRVLGVRAIGRDSDSIVGTVSIMIDNDLPYSYLLDSIQPHPSLSESLQGAAHIIHGDLLGYQPGEEYDYQPS